MKKTTKTEKTEPKSTKKSRKKGAEEGRKRRERYFQSKAKLMKLEEKNYSKLMVLHDNGIWWKMFGHSALIYHYEIAKRIGLSSKLQPDTDYNFKSEEGVVNIRDIDLLEHKLTLNKILPLETWPEGRVYNIGKKYTDSDLAYLKKTKDLEWQRINKIILPKDLFPSLFKLIRDLNIKVYHSTQKMETYAREKLASPILERTNKMMRDYSLAANGEGLKDSGYLDELYRDAAWVIAQMTVISELRLMAVERIYPIVYGAAKIKREIERCKPREVE